MGVKCCLTIEELSSNIKIRFIQCFVSHRLDCKKIFAKIKALLKGHKHNNEAELQCSTNKDHEEPLFKSKLN